MYTVIDYLRYYRNVKLENVSFNAMDNLVLAILAYLPVDEFNSPKTIEEIHSELMSVRSNEFRSLMVPNSFKVLDLVVLSDRYKDLIIENVSIKKDDNTQFCAFTFKLGKIKIISFRGTDGSLIGWIENLRISYDYPTYTQSLAIDYLKKNISITDKEVYVVGHSKGGNLAMVSAGELSSYYFKKVKKVYNFDGPGFRKKEFDSIKYKELEKKLVNIIPTGSVIGTLLNNENYTVVKSNALAFEQHYPTTWSVFGEYFVCGELSKVSVNLNISTTIGIENLKYDQVKDAFEQIISGINKDYTSDFKFNFNDVKSFTKNMKNVNPEVYKCIEKIIDSMISALYNRKGE